MSTIGPGSGQQHLIALMRTIRAKLADPLALPTAAQPTAPSTAHAAGPPTAATTGPAQPPQNPLPTSAGQSPGGQVPGLQIPGSKPGQSLPTFGPLPGIPVLPETLGPPAAQPSAAVPSAAVPSATVPHLMQPAPLTRPVPAGPGMPPGGTAGPALPGVPCGAHPAPGVQPGHVPPPSDGAANPLLPGGLHAGGPDGDTVLRDLRRTMTHCLDLAGPLHELTARLRDTLAEVRPQLLIPIPRTAEHPHEQLTAALTWLVDNLDRPQVVAAGCGQLGGVLREWGITPQQAQLVGAALAEALRASLGQAWGHEFDVAWRTTWNLAHRWVEDGSAAAGWTPVTWTGVVVDHAHRRPDLAVVTVRPHLPYRFVPGQYTRIEVPQRPGVWRPYSLGGAPRLDNVLELHVRANGPSGVSAALVYDTAVGDRVKFRPAAGESVLDPEGTRDLLMIAGDTGVAPLKALLTELAVTGDDRSAVLFWGVRCLDELYDIVELEEIARACRRATVIPVISEGDSGPYASGPVTDAIAAYGQWSEHEVFLAGPPPMVAGTSGVLQQLGVHPDRIRHDPPILS